jgi:hypothetical protein
MNYSAAVFLINDNARAIACTYQPEDQPKDGHPGRAYVFKTLDATIKVDDFVVVPTNTRHGMTVNKVVAVDVDIDYDSDIKFAWIIGKVDKAAYDALLAKEAEAVTAINLAERTRKRHELRASLMAHSAEALKNLPITVIGTPELATPTA